MFSAIPSPFIKTRPARFRLGAFSLVELLAAMGILVVLVALLFPASQAASAYMSNAKCVSNLRHIGAGLHAYMADFRGEYPPNRHNVRYTEQTGRNPWPSEVLNGTVPTNSTVYVKFAGMGSANLTSRAAAGPWFCPGDKERPIALSASTYGPNIYLGRDDRAGGAENPAWQAWWAKPMAHPKSGRLIYLIDHNLMRTPATTAGTFSEKSWPVATGPKPGENSDKSVVDFDRHGEHANALLVEGSVQAFKKEDLEGTAGRALVDPTR